MTIPEILKEFRTIAVVGLSANPDRASFRVSRYMQDQGYRIVPVRPNADEILGEKVYPTLKDIPFPVEIVDVFRRSDTVLPIAEEAVAIGAKVLWLQETVINHDAQRICEDAGMEVIMDTCILKEHMKAGL